MTDEQAHPDIAGRVVPFRPRASVPAEPSRGDGPILGASPLDDLSRYEHGEGRDDFRHRMITNVLAFVFCACLVIAGVWLVGKMAEMRKNQDCVLSGRRGCTPVDVPVRNRW